MHAVQQAVILQQLTVLQVWEVLTDYERLPEVVPNLAVCERVQTPSGMSSRVTRLRQVPLLTFASILALASIPEVASCLTLASVLEQPFCVLSWSFPFLLAHTRATPDTFTVLYLLYTCLGFYASSWAW